MPRASLLAHGHDCMINTVSQSFASRLSHTFRSLFHRTSTLFEHTVMPLMLDSRYHYLSLIIYSCILWKLDIVVDTSCARERQDLVVCSGQDNMAWQVVA
jgi:hypothetical protein